MHTCQVAIIGAGPVGLLSAACLAQQGLDVRVFERERERRPRSRAIGVHPPGLRALAQVGLADVLVARGVPVRRGVAHAGRRCLGSIAFDSLGEPFPFVLAVPQSETEGLLERRLAQLSPATLRRGHELVALQSEATGVSLTLRSAGGMSNVRAQFVVGCDGKYSRVRELSEIPFRGGAYPGCFLMGDARDDTDFGSRAAVYFSAGGLVESFPLPGRRRRWVVSTGARRVEPDRRLLDSIVRERTGQALDASTCSHLSVFQAEHYLAARMVQGRVLLAGDAAHVVSPIGGQGMNLGFLDAESLARCFARGAQPRSLAQYERARLRAAQQARRRAELFMRIGLAQRFARARNGIVRALLSPTLSAASARLFAMQGLSPA